LSPRTGRPTDDPKKYETRVRMSKSDLEKINYCCEKFGLTKAEVIRRGIEAMYQEAQKRK